MDSLHKEALEALPADEMSKRAKGGELLVLAVERDDAELVVYLIEQGVDCYQVCDLHVSQTTRCSSTG